MVEYIYNRNNALEYAKKWALKRNPNYYDFSGIVLGGDCTNFISQCLYAGCPVMNYAKDVGWYYINPNNRAAAWTSVEYLNKFLTNNMLTGPYAQPCTKNDLTAGDIVQLSFNGRIFSHTMIVVKVEFGKIYTASHSNDSYMRNLNTYNYKKIRFLKILGYRNYT